MENGQETLIDAVALDAHAHHFEYRFPHDAGMHQYRLVYHTKPEALKVGRSVYRNWVADWTVWGNGVRPEWSIVPADFNKTYYKEDSELNGLQDLSGVETITVTDTLPKGWLVDESSVGGYFAAAPAFDGNNGTLSRFNDASRTSVTGTVGRQSRAVVVITYRTILPVGDVENLQTMKKLEFNQPRVDGLRRRAGGRGLGEGARGEQAARNARQKRRAERQYGEIQCDRSRQNIPHFFDSDTFTANDALSGESGKAPYAAFSGNFKVLAGGHDLTETAQQTGKFSATVLVGANGWQSAEIVIPTDLSNGTVSARTHDIIVQYEVKLNGMIGDNRELRNSAQIQGSYSMTTEYSSWCRVKKEDGALGAAGSMRVTKVDDSMNTIAGNPATFNVCQVNLHKAPNQSVPANSGLGGAVHHATLKTDASGNVYLAVNSANGHSGGGKRDAAIYAQQARLQHVVYAVGNRGAKGA